MDNITTSIQKAFASDEAALKDFHNSIHENLSETEKNLKKTINQMILIVFAYFIVTQSSIESVDLGPFKISNMNLIVKFFPIVICYKLYQFVGLQSFRRSLNVAWNESFEKLYPKIVANGLSLLLKPENSINTEELYEVRNQSRISNKMEQLRTVILFLQLLILPVAFVLYALCLNFYRFGYRDILVWIVLASVLLIFIQTTFLFNENRSYDTD